MQMNMTQTMGANPAMQSCIQHCEDCHMMCMRCVQHCLGMGGCHAEPDHIGLMLDCADICRTSADYMLRSSPRHTLTCGVCAQVCQQCADECEAMANGDSMMMACADACRRCAESCRGMSMSA